MVGAKNTTQRVVAVEEVFPGSKITANRVDEYPIRVIVTAQVGGTKIKVWEGRQQSLFRKNWSQRERSMQEMKMNLEDLKEDFE
eukprot:CAMPEP_0185732928 /NCGR_PEP_ID=MMETSP1171-20130828/17961_1 /TAXON_ID=374046 /ORGANISM="Helicotheca tamensis, Strain CCMP826" /LENGTH=83 /DNA_ID=CAMNT_0028402535 /DNA_START=136 /DNA_END=386 /DNA_ORIENTATION=+